jgi:prepilin-type N-terminal cleavage/methylation domain-containing protein
LYKNLSTTRRPRAFSLIELAVVLIVIAVIAAIAIPTFTAVIRSSEDRAESVELDAVMRDAYALARLRGNDLPTAQDVADALAEIGAAAPGINAYIEVSGTARLYSQSEWDASPVVPGGVRAYIYLADPANDRVAVASMSPNSETTCVAVKLESGSAPESFTQEVADPADCDGYLALGGPVTPVAPTAGAEIEVGMVITGDSSSGGWDDVAITNNAATNFLTDDFNRANGPLSAPWLDTGGVLPAAEVFNNSARGTAASTSHVSFISVPEWSLVSVEGTLTDVPTGDSSAALIVADLALFSAEAQVQAGTFDIGGRFRHQVSTTVDPQAYVFADAGPAAPGDQVQVIRLSRTLSKVYVNGQLRSTMSRAQIGTVTGTISGVADPTVCSVVAYAQTAVNNENHLIVGSAGPVGGDGSYTMHVPTNAPVKVGAVCGPEARFPNGAIWASGADPLIPAAGQTLADIDISFA